MMRAEGLKSKDDLGLSRILVAGGLAGSFGWSFIMPCGRMATKKASNKRRRLGGASKQAGTLWHWVAPHARTHAP